LKKIIIACVILLLLAGCNGGEKDTSTIDLIKSDIELYFTNNKLEEKGGNGISFEGTIERLKSGAEFYEDEYEKEIQIKLAELLEKNDKEGLESLYKEIGGNPDKLK